MTDFTSAAYLSNAARTEGEMKTALEQNRDATTELPGGAATTTLTIASGSVTPTVRNGGAHLIDTEGAAASDDLTNIVQTNTPDGRRLTLSAADAARTVVVKHAAGGTGEILLQDDADFSIDDTDKFLELRRSGTQWVEIARSYGADRHSARQFLEVGVLAGQCRFNYSSTTECLLMPCNGNRLPLKYNGKWIMAAIPAAGVSFTTGGLGLSSSTVYNAYAYWSGSAIAFEASATGHSADADTGVEIKTGDATRTLIGKVRTNASTQFETFMVLSWFNRRAKSNSAAITTNRTSTSVWSTLAEFHSEIRVNFLSWGDEDTRFNASGHAFGNTGSIAYSAALCVDGVAGGNVRRISTGAPGTDTNVTWPIDVADSARETEGYHYATLAGAVASTATMTIGAGSGDARATRLEVAVNG